MTEEQPREGRVIDLSVEVPGTVAEVWAAISTGPGIGSWFIAHELEERVGGAVTMDFGDRGTDTARTSTPGRSSAGSGTAIVIAEGSGDRVLVGFQRYSYLDATTDPAGTAWEPVFSARIPLDARV